MRTDRVNLRLENQATLCDRFCDCLAGMGHVLERVGCAVDSLFGPPESIKSFRASIVDLQGDALARKCHDFVQQLFLEKGFNPKAQITHQMDSEMHSEKEEEIRGLLQTYCADIPEVLQALNASLERHPHSS